MWYDSPIRVGHLNGSGTLRGRPPHGPHHGDHAVASDAEWPHAGVAGGRAPLLAPGPRLPGLGEHGRHDAVLSPDVLVQPGHHARSQDHLGLLALLQLLQVTAAGQALYPLLLPEGPGAALGVRVALRAAGLLVVDVAHPVDAGLGVELYILQNAGAGAVDVVVWGQVLVGGRYDDFHGTPQSLDGVPVPGQAASPQGDSCEERHQQCRAAPPPPPSDLVRPPAERLVGARALERPS
mmetsp:Transcript_40730/g.117616  ORF Transcript_40730/g.117616 Transcript_40730/m.117616 type:complete len:237 (-) Transcript_40730:77-787(-)